MQVYDFTLILSGCDVLTEDLAEALVAAGCDDGSPGSSEGTVTIDMRREADCLETALRSAIADVQKAGCAVDSVRIEAQALAGP